MGIPLPASLPRHVLSCITLCVEGIRLDVCVRTYFLATAEEEASNGLQPNPLLLQIELHQEAAIYNGIMNPQSPKLQRERHQVACTC
jgi:hypothetical protein